MATLRCTSCALAFDTTEAQREHYRTELHRYNLKRRTNDLGPVTDAEFQRRKAAALALAGQTAAGQEGFHAKCAACNRSFASKATLEQHLKSKKHQLAAAAAAAAAGSKQQQPPQPVVSTSTAAERAREAEAQRALAEGMARVAVDGSAAPMEQEGEEGEVPAPLPVDLSPEVCIFCNERCPDLEAAVLHMWKRHGFHIPDGEYLVDLTGLLRYCAEKVKVGCLCLYCNGKGRNFASARDVQRHMADKSHCKLLYEEGEDLHEFRPFYDFTASYAHLPATGSAAARGAAAGGAQQGREGDGEEEDDDELSLETMDSDYEEVSEDGDDAMEMGEEEDVEALLRRDAAYVSELGELVLPDGRILGSREYARYYKQRYRAEDSRLALVASKAEAADRGFFAGGGGAGAGAGGGALITVPGAAGGGQQQLMARGVGCLAGMDPAARRAVLRVTKAARRHYEKVRLRQETNANKFHKRPDIGV